MGAYYMERMMGIEPTLQAWEARVLPLNYIRKILYTHYNTYAEINKQKIL